MSEDSLASSRVAKKIKDEELFEIELSDFRAPPKVDDPSNDWVWKVKDGSESSGQQDIIVEEEVDK